MVTRMKTRRSLLALPVFATALAAMSNLRAQTSVAAVEAARRLVEATAPTQRAELLLQFTNAARSDWN